MSKPPIIEKRLSCSPSDSQSFFVGVGFGSVIAADALSLSGSFLESGLSIV
jgi:hypothetical protein